MRLDWEIAKRGWRRYAAYPWATAAGVFTNTVFGFLQAYILLAIYHHRTNVGGFDSTDAVTYVWLAQAMIMTVYVFGWYELALRIRDGSIATDLARPLDPQRYWLAFDLGRAPYHLLLRGVPPFLVGAAVFDLHYPSPLDAAAFLVSLTLAVVVSFGFRFALQLGRVLAARLPRRRDALDDDRHLLLRDGDSAPVLPGLAARGRVCAAVRVDHPDADRCLARQTARARARRRRSGCSSCWGAALLGLGTPSPSAGTRRSW